jgi:hypothetical protein
MNFYVLKRRNEEKMKFTKNIEMQIIIYRSYLDYIERPWLEETLNLNKTPNQS